MNSLPLNSPFLVLRGIALRLGDSQDRWGRVRKGWHGYGRAGVNSPSRKKNKNQDKEKGGGQR